MADSKCLLKEVLSNSNSSDDNNGCGKVEAPPCGVDSVETIVVKLGILLAASVGTTMMDDGRGTTKIKPYRDGARRWKK